MTACAATHVKCQRCDGSGQDPAVATFDWPCRECQPSTGPFQRGQRVVYTKRGEQRCYDTEWRATYLYRTPAGKHAIRIDGRKRVSLVAEKNLETHDAHP